MDEISLTLGNAMQSVRVNSSRSKRLTHFFSMSYTILRAVQISKSSGVQTMWLKPNSTRSMSLRCAQCQGPHVIHRTAPQASGCIHTCSNFPVQVIWKTMAFDLAPGGCEVTDTSHLVEGENGFEVKGQGASCLLHALKKFGLPEK